MDLQTADGQNPVLHTKALAGIHLQRNRGLALQRRTGLNAAGNICQKIFLILNRQRGAVAAKCATQPAHIAQKFRSLVLRHRRLKISHANQQ
jgi:hypothetical protein